MIFKDNRSECSAIETSVRIQYLSTEASDYLLQGGAARKDRFSCQIISADHTSPHIAEQLTGSAFSRADGTCDGNYLMMRFGRHFVKSTTAVLHGLIQSESALASSLHSYILQQVGVTLDKRIPLLGEDSKDEQRQGDGPDSTRPA